ncbi:MAG: serine/threonine protein kinase [candidate division Zixibacteria bacterium]|nr:serine/threonine protein kinase [candidate division Zixibacteria bacterium]
MSDNTERHDHDSSPPERHDPLGIIGWKIGGKYKIRSYLGGGGFGEVYDGYNVNLPEQKLVVKFFKRVQSRDKFAKEAKILCRLDHPNICRVIDFLEEEGALVVAYIDGQDGGQILRSSGPLSADQFLNVSRSMTSALAYAHERKIAHRDIKPGNIMIDRNNHTYLIDFGIAKEMGSAATRTAYQSLTPMFAAPERQQGDVDYNPFLSDIYEMGVTLFNFCTNTMPYRNPANPNIDEWGGPAADRLSQQLIQILRKATHPNPARRYKSAQALADEFQKLTLVYSPKRKKRALAYVIPVIIVVIAAGSFGWWKLQQNKGSNATSKPAVTTQSESARQQPVPTVSPAKDTAVGAGDKEAASGKKSQTLTQEPTGTDSKPKAADKSVAEKAPEPKKEAEATKPPPPPPEPVLRIQTNPASAVTLYVDGQRQTPGTYFEASRGTHQVEAMHPDYPVLTRSVRVSEEKTDHAIDLQKEFASAGRVDLRLALIPPSDEHVLELALNGVKQRYSSFPVFDLTKPAGLWQVEAGVFALNSSGQKSIVVDSCATFPFGGGRHAVLKGNSGRIDFATLAGENVSVIPFVIYWSEK